MRKDIEIREVPGAEERAEICESILRALPEWFAFEPPILDYARQARDLPVFAAYDGGEAVGFLAVKQHTPQAWEVCVMGIQKTHHRMGIGRELMRRAVCLAKERGAKYLTVKTVAELSPDEGYARTRAFYAAVGFVPLEVFPLYWDRDNPCLYSVMAL